MAIGIIDYRRANVLMTGNSCLTDQSNNADPLISIIVPVYNVAPYLERCVDSLLRQSFEAFELLLIDDGSDDGSETICDALACTDARIKVFHKPNGGLSDARNYGIKEARAQWIAFVDSDDALHRDCLQSLYADAISTDADIAVCQYQVWNGEETVEISCVAGEVELLSGAEALERLLYDRGLSVSACAKLYKASLFEGLSYPFGKHYEDVCITGCLLMRCARVAVSTVPYYLYFMREDSISHKALTTKSFDRFELAVRLGSEVARTYGDAYSTAVKRYTVVHALAVLRLKSEDQNAFKQDIDRLRNHVKSHAAAVLFDVKSSIRDKTGVVSCLLGKKFYSFAWDIYASLTGRR